MVDRAASPTSVHAPDAPLTDHQLARLAAAVRPMAAVNTAAGCRSVHPDPDRPPGGAAPEVTPLDHACDSGVLADARHAWSRWVLLPAEDRATLLWLAEHDALGANAAAAALAMARDRLPAEARREAELALRVDAAVGLVRALRAQVRRGGPDVVQTLRTAEQKLGAIRAAHRAAVEAFERWGHARLASAHSAWFQAVSDAT